MTPTANEYFLQGPARGFAPRGINLHYARRYNIT